jgi:hypothetical protein
MARSARELSDPRAAAAKQNPSGVRGGCVYPAEAIPAALASTGASTEFA